MKKNRLVILGLIYLFLFLFSIKTADASVCMSPSSQATIDCQRNQEIGRIYSERSQILAPYQQFFTEVGVNLTSTTTAEQYQAWYEELIGTKIKYDKKQEEIVAKKMVDEERQAGLAEQERLEKIRKENEGQAKIAELETRVNILESQKPTVISSPSQTTNKATTTVMSQVKPSNSKPQTTFSSTGPSVVENIHQTPIKKVGWLTRIINWFKGK